MTKKEEKVTGLNSEMDESYLKKKSTLLGY